MKHRIVLLAFLGTALAGCAQPGNSSLTNANTTNAALPSKYTASKSFEENWQLMTGTWFGQQPLKNGGIRQQITQRYPDATFVITFRYIKRDGSENFLRDYGAWGISGPIYFSLTTAEQKDDQVVDTEPGNEFDNNAYRILRLNEESFEYEHVVTGDRYILKRVEPGFRFPN